jgi:cysteinyl-tRNA synthetase
VRQLRLGGAALPVVGRARVYVCGITPYDVTHLGHAATFVWADTAARVLRSHSGAEVDVCRNVTDVDDVLTAAAARAGAPYASFAAVQEFAFEQDMATLGVRAPNHQPRAHAFVRQVVALAGALLEAGQAYERDGTVYFRGGEVPGRVGVGPGDALRLATEYGDQPDDPAKDDPLDVAVWRASAAGQPAWPSPWGAGRPGWHAECAAMALTTFGPALDLHAGGADLRFPHHAYEAAMAEAVTGVRPFARAWLQVGTVGIDGAKMAKSAGNLVLVSDLVRRHTPAAVRLLLLDRPWRADWDYREADLAAAERRLERLYAAAGAPGEGDAAALAAATATVAALTDDLDVPRALDIAEDAGGLAARMVLGDLGLS